MTTTDREAETRALQSLAEIWRDTANSCETQAAKDIRRGGFEEGRFDRGQAAAFRTCADGLERQIASPVVRAMLSACPETQPAQSGEA